MSIDFQRLEQVLAGAAGRADPAERAAYLAEACGEDGELHAEVRRLLAAHEQAGDFLEVPVKPAPKPISEDGPGETETRPDADKAIENPGAIIGRYKLLEEIGEGGFGVVYMAEQVEPVQRKVALKIIKAGMDTREVVARFKAERQALALMDHTNIARVFDGGVTETGRPYFVMELVRGIPITEFCDQRNLTTPERLKLFMQVCHAVQHAHQKGIIHRDLKPSNVLVTLIDGEPLPKVIDFGVAKALGQRLTDQTLFTGFLRMVGTPAYMSPEQADLSGVDVDTRADIYALGVLLYELLTGVTPFDAETLRKAALDEIRRMIRETEPPRPSTRLQTLGEKLAEVSRHRQTEPAALRKLVRGDLDWIVMKCLEKDRRRRYETANGLAGDIERHMNDEAVAARPPSRFYRFQKSVRRNRLAYAAVVAIAAVMILGLGVSTWTLIQEKRARERAVAAERLAEDRADEARAARTEAERSAAEAQAVSDFLVNDLLGSAAPSRALGREVTVKEVLANAESKIDTAFEGQPLREAAIRQAIGGTYGQLGQYDAAFRHLDRALALRTEFLGPEHPATLRSRSSLGSCLRDLGKLDAARKVLEETLAIQKRVFGAEHPDTLTSMNKLAFVLVLQDHGEEALELYQEAFSISKRVLGPEHELTVASMVRGALARFGDPEEARKLYNENLALRKRIKGADDPSSLNSMHNLAIVLQQFGQEEDARRLFAEALEGKRRILGVEHLDTLRTMDGLAIALRNLGRLEEARKLLEEALAVEKRVLGPEHPKTLESLRALGLTLRNQGKPKEASDVFQEIVTIDPLAAESLNELAWMLATHADAKVRDGQRALEYAEKAVAATGRSNPVYLDTLAAAHAEMGQFSEAASVQQEAIALLKNEGERKDYASRLRRYLVGESAVPKTDVLTALARQSPQGVTRAVELALGMEPPKAPRELLVCAEYLLIGGESARAVRCIEKAIAAGGREHYYHKSLGWALLRQGRRDAAQHAFNDVLRSLEDGPSLPPTADPDHWTAAYFLDRVSREHYAERWRSDTRFRAQFACFPWFYIGQRLEIEGKREQAIKAYRKSAELGELPEAHHIRHWSAYRLHVLTGEPLEPATRAADSQPAKQTATLPGG